MCNLYLDVHPAFPCDDVSLSQLCVLVETVDVVDARDLTPAVFLPLFLFQCDSNNVIVQLAHTCILYKHTPLCMQACTDAHMRARAHTRVYTHTEKKIKTLERSAS